MTLDLFNIQRPVGLFGVNEQGSQHYEGLEHGGDVEDGP